MTNRTGGFGVSVFETTRAAGLRDDDVLCRATVQEVVLIRAAKNKTEISLALRYTRASRIGGGCSKFRKHRQNAHLQAKLLLGKKIK